MKLSTDTGLRNAINEIGQSVGKYIRHEFTSLHQQMKADQNIHGVCKQDCSKRHKDLIANWCPICQAWGRGILTTYKPSHNKAAKWQLVDTAKFASDPIEFAKLFLHRDVKDPHPGFESDSSNALNILTNCSYFGLDNESKRLVQEMRDVRNDCIHDRKQFTKERRQNYFETMKRFLQMPKLRHWSCDALERLKMWENIDYYVGYCSVGVILRNSWIIYLVIVSVSGISKYSDIGPEPFPASGCPNEHGRDWAHPLLLTGSLLMHKGFTGRDWLFRSVKDIILNPATRTNGALLVADMGYGKSAFAAEIICAENGSVAMGIRSRLLGYHICKFNEHNTQKADMLVKNLVFMIRRQLTNYKMHLQNMVLRSGLDCQSDPVGCFQQAILEPLKAIHSKQTMVIVVDGLDECGDIYDKSSVLSLLRQFTEQLPTWIKVIYTSRNSSVIIRDLSTLITKHLLLSDKRNLDDNQKYLQKHAIENARDIVKSSGGSFLCLKQYAASKDFSFAFKQGVSECLNHVFETNFRRVFNKTFRFEFVRFFFEILCASFHPLKDDMYREIVKVLNISLDMDYEFPQRMRNISDFVRKNENERWEFTHKSLFDWLTDPTRSDSDFFVSLRKGHELLTRFFLKSSTKVILHWELQPTDLIKHLLNSGDNPDLIKDFKVKFFSFVKRLDLDSLAFGAAASGDENALDTLLFLGADIQYRSFLPPVTVSMGNVLRKVTLRNIRMNMLQVAVQYGHTNIVRLLMEKDPTLARFHVKIEKDEGSAFHMAARLGHKEIMDVLLTMDKSLLSIGEFYDVIYEGFEVAVKVFLQHGIRSQFRTCQQIFRSGQNDTFELINDKNVTGKQQWITFSFKNVTTIKSEHERFSDHVAFELWRITCQTPLHYAIDRGNTAIVKMLLEADPALVKTSDFSGFTPILLATARNCSKVVRLILEQDSSAIDNKCKPRDFKKRFHLRKTLMFDEYIRLAGTDKDLYIYEDRLQKWLERHTCPLGAGVGHVAALYDARGVIKILGSELYHHIWLARDFFNRQPFYYAFCYGSKEDALLLLKMYGTKSLCPGTCRNYTSCTIDYPEICDTKSFPPLTKFSCRVVSHGHFEINIASGRQKLSLLATRSSEHISSSRPPSIKETSTHVSKWITLLKKSKAYLPHKCRKLANLLSADTANANCTWCTNGFNEMYDWTIDGVTMHNMPELLTRCIQAYMISRLSKVNPWEDYQDLKDETKVEHSIELADIP